VKTNKTEGVVLDSTLYQENHSIVSLFTPDQGIVRLFVSRRKSIQSPPTPLTRIECYYTRAREETLCRLREFAIRDPYLHLRETFQGLRLAGALARILSQTQLLEKPAPALYQLLLIYWQHAPSCPNPDAYLASFLLKLLRHEGLLGLNSSCAQCGGVLEQAALAAGETLCSSHAPPWSILFDYQELLTICTLTSARAMGEIYSIVLAENTKEKIHHLFDQLTEREMRLFSII
jgi:DNA repair protein RecO (recombination protein O)